MSLLKPSLQTPFHIDFAWWEQNDRDWHVYMRSLLCPEHQLSFNDVQEDTLIDWIDPVTAEVKQVDGVQHALMSSLRTAARFCGPAHSHGGGCVPHFPGQRQSADERRGSIEEA